MSQVTLIYNPMAGVVGNDHEGQIEEAASVFRASGKRVTLAATRGPGDAEGLARDAARGGANLIVVWGGDGTLNEVVNGIAEGKAALGILPGGTANIAAKELNVPHHAVAAARRLIEWPGRRIALGRAVWRDASTDAIRSRYFLNVAGIGFDAHVIRRLDKKSKRFFGAITYLATGLVELSRYAFPPFTCRVGSEEISATFAAIQRSQRYAGWFAMAPEAHLLKPQLTLCAFTSRSKARYAIYAAAVALKRHSKLRDVQLRTGNSIECSGDRAISFELDGELMGQLPVRFELVPDALTILAP